MALALVHAAIQIVNYLGMPQVDAWQRLESLFDLGNESNFPTWYTSFLLLLTAMVIGLITTVIARSTTRDYFYHWIFLSIFFLGLSMEEEIQIHELISEKLEEQFELGGIFAWTWVIPGLILVLVVILVYLKFAFALPRITRNTLAIATAVYIGSAIGLEMVSASYSENPDPRFAVEWILVFLEETLEMLAILIFLYAFLNFLRLYVDQISLSLIPQQVSRDMSQQVSTPDRGDLQSQEDQPVVSANKLS